MSVRNWLAAARLRTLPLAAASVLCGTLAAALQHRSNTAVTALCLLTALLLQTLSNFANDYGDACNGADTPARQGPQRMVGSGRISGTAMARGMMLTAAACCLAGTALLAAALPSLGAAELQNWLLWLLLGAAAIAAAVAYTAGKKPYGYIGLGDLSVFVFFGWVGVLGTEYLHTGRLNTASWLPATALGLWCAMVLNINNMRDIETDRQAGKITVAVRLGLVRAKRYHAALLFGAILLWWLWLPHYFAHRFFLNTALLSVSGIHLFFIKKAQSSRALDRLLPQWSITVLLWILLLWLLAPL